MRRYSSQKLAALKDDDVKSLAPIRKELSQKEAERRSADEKVAAAFAALTTSIEDGDVVGRAASAAAYADATRELATATAAALAVRSVLEAAEREISHKQTQQLAYKDGAVELTVDSIVAVATDNRKAFVECRIVDLGLLEVSGDYLYVVRKLDDGRELKARKASEIFPVEMARKPTP